MQAIANIIGFFARPLVSFLTAISIAVSFILGAIANPQGAVNLFICKIIDLVALFLPPPTPESLTISHLIASSFGSSAFGYGIVVDTAQMIGAMFAFVVIIKIYKLIPFKAT